MITIRKSIVLPLLAVMLIVFLQTIQGIPHNSEIRITYEGSSSNSSESSESSESSDSDESDESIESKNQDGSDDELSSELSERIFSGGRDETLARVEPDDVMYYS
ncbi:uncharacterized protein LOC127279544 [Leptopilina boulardi]|uniref:uncharacterized protein LOC127279544 n=1 Tax=Leptopilina boulardi TaxID=63433 RepID=UPI0021F635C5|nr:uncharacterized protein LOC127279544 [Leptopilina boulardi]